MRAPGTVRVNGTLAFEQGHQLGLTCPCEHEVLTLSKTRVPIASDQPGVSPPHPATVTVHVIPARGHRQSALGILNPGVLRDCCWELAWFSCLPNGTEAKAEGGLRA